MTITVFKGDITQLDVEAIVNAANSGLMGGGGVDGAIHRVGGPKIMEECKVIRERQGGCPTGEAVITSGGRLKAKYVIHTVGPVWRDGYHDEEKLLANAYRNSLRLAEEKKLVSVAFPNISTGVYGFPKRKAAEIAVNEVQQFLTPDRAIKDVVFCCFDDENYNLYRELLRIF